MCSCDHFGICIDRCSDVFIIGMVKQWRWWLRGLILAIFFASMFWLSAGTDRVYASPDENANAFFAQTFAESFGFCAPQPLNNLAEGLIHPRSTIAPGTCIVPSTFLGFPFMLGAVSLVAGYIGTVFVTPVLAIVGIVALWWMIRTLTNNDRLADWSALFTIAHPAFWYYGARVFMNNVPFVSFLILSVALFIVAHRQRSIWIGVAVGAILSLALSFRLADAPIAVIVIGLVMIFYRSRIVWRAMFGVLIGILIMASLYLGMNAQTYGSILVTGYNAPDLRTPLLAGEGMGAVEAPSNVLISISSLLFPFGFHPRAILTNVLHYGFLLYPISSILALVGGVIAWRRREDRLAWRKFVVAGVVATVWMVVMYGSWRIIDNPDPLAITVGNSHVRYWLPLFVMSSVFAALAFDELWKRFRGSMRWVGVGVLVGILAMNAQTVFGGTDGFIATRAALMTFEQKRSVIMANTESDAIVIVDRADKYVFPHRQVIVPLRSDSTYAILPTLVPMVPVYYFGITFPEKDLNHLNEVILAPMHLKATMVVTEQEESLYRITVDGPVFASL